MIVNDIPFINCPYRVVDWDGTIIHEFNAGDMSDDVSPDVATRNVTALWADENTLIVEVD